MYIQGYPQRIETSDTTALYAYCLLSVSSYLIMIPRNCKISLLIPRRLNLTLG